ncbi:MAG: MFS transporter, partial [Hyphomicrobiales bacterium]
YDRDEAASNIAYVTMAMVVAPMVAPTIGGYLDVWTGWQGGFYFSAAVGAIVWIAAVFRLYETRPASNESGQLDPFDFFRKSAQLLKEPAFIGYAFNVAFGSGIFFSFLAGAPFIVISIFGGTAGDYGNYFIFIAFSYMCGNFFAGRFARRLGANFMIMMGSAITMFGLAIMLTGAITGGFNLYWLFGAMSVIAVSNGLTIPSGTAAAISVRPDILGTGAGLSGFFQIGVGALATYLVGVFHDGTYWPMILVMVGTGTVSFLFMLMALKTARDQAA